MTTEKAPPNKDKLPYEENLEKFAPTYFPEKFTAMEKKILKPFFSNNNKPLFVIHDLPEEVIGALSSRYSRATKSLRRLFLDEYIDPILNPDKQKDWEELSAKEKRESKENSKQLLEWIDRLNKTGGLSKVVNVQRGRKFFDKWLAGYGDDSIAEEGGVHLCLEGVSNITSGEIQEKRIALSPLEKSSRYVQFWDRRQDGNYQYEIPGEIRKTPIEAEYKKTMDLLFDTYAQVAQPYLEYIKDKYPIEEDETEGSFNGSRGAKRFDDIRDLLPFATQTSFAVFGNGRAYEDVINRLLDHPLGELRWWGQAICNELSTTVPSFVSRPKTERGAEIQIYRHKIMDLKNSLAKKILSKKETPKYPHWVNLISNTKDPEVEVLSTFIYSGTRGVTLADIRKQVSSLSVSEREKYFKQILGVRNLGEKDVPREKVRFRKVPRSFENAHFTFEIWGRGGDYRDLHRHRQLTQERPDLSTVWGYDLEKEVLESPFVDKFKFAMEEAGKLYKKLDKIDPKLAQYAVPFGYIQNWYMNMTAREIYWISELRTGPQGRDHYRQICQDIAKQASEVAPALFSGMKTDWGSYALSRRESEKKIDKKLKSLQK